MLADDPESLHQYRISLRVMRSLLGFLRPYCKRGILKGEMRAIKKLQDPTSRLRELDMLLAALDPQTDEAGMVRAECSEEREAFIEQFDSEATQRSLRRVVKRVRELPWRRAVWQCSTWREATNARGVRGGDGTRRLRRPGSRA